MLLDRRRILLFGLQFVPLLVLLALSFPWLLPGYQRVLLAAANPLARTLDPPLVVERVDHGAWRVQRRASDGTLRGVFSIPAETLRMIHTSLVLLPALLLATPVPLRRRLRLLLLGLVLLGATQVLVHLVFMKAWVHYQYTDRHDPLYKLIVVLHSTAGQLLPAVLWGALTWRDWLGRGTGAKRTAAPPARNRPCPCGSGRKYKHCCGEGA